MLVAAAVITLLILANALYVAAEFGAVGAKRSRLRRLAEDGNRLAARILPIVDDAQALDRYIAVSQVGITLSSLVLGAYAQATLAPRVAPLVDRLGAGRFDPDYVAATTVLITLTALQMVLGELVPKSVALQYPTQSALVTLLPMQWSLRIWSRAIDALNGSGVFLLKLMRVPVTGHRHVHSPEEIELLIAESRDGGLLEPEEQVRLHGALRLGLRSARELMVPRDRLATIDAAAPLEGVLQTVAASPYSRLPAFRDDPDNIVGILHTKDLVTDFVKGERRGLVAALLRPLVRVRDDTPADRLLTFLRERRSHHALVVDERGAVAGLITLEDVLAELLGGIADEFKVTRLGAPRPREGEKR